MNIISKKAKTVVTYLKAITSMTVAPFHKQKGMVEK
jgi:hypothetical protein